MRQQQRALKKTNRELERDRHGLERQEKQLVSLNCGRKLDCMCTNSMQCNVQCIYDDVVM